MKGPIIDQVDIARAQAIQYLREHDFFKVESYESTLDNSIHSVFAHNRFPGLSSRAYATMKPALQLATRFTQEPKFLDYFEHQMQSTTVATFYNPLPYYQLKKDRATNPEAIKTESSGTSV
jgi:hypothetical protein